MDALLASLEREAEAEIARTLADGRARAAALTREAEERLGRRRADTIARREAEGRAALEGALSRARHAARRRILTARARLLDRLFADVRALLPGLTAAPKYRTALSGEVARALAFTGEHPVAVRCAAALRAELSGMLKTDSRVTVRADPGMATGFRVATTDGSLEVDGTLEGRMERLRPRLAVEALAALRDGSGA